MKRKFTFNISIIMTSILIAIPLVIILARRFSLKNKITVEDPVQNDLETKLAQLLTELKNKRMYEKVDDIVTYLEKNNPSSSCIETEDIKLPFIINFCSEDIVVSSKFLGEKMINYLREIKAITEDNKWANISSMQMNDFDAKISYTTCVAGIIVHLNIFDEDQNKAHCPTPKQPFDYYCSLFEQTLSLLTKFKGNLIIVNDNIFDKLSAKIIDKFDIKYDEDKIGLGMQNMFYNVILNHHSSNLVTIAYSSN
ncbi:hypothetical protein TUBRATIS_17450 [Tubulinosema ratisbonensis]|uniref:BAAT/Acyl-CoA thioester hydrolase C-terminal domain-containing protein n=1 Tax=Tubulinosema ratisbonensis TaxID=291195 RepID=A0A437AL57_9MICR|nr:hypothetical protein TUBRATIS_17450 [Tubulinosema ratisbonensis]